MATLRPGDIIQITVQGKQAEEMTAEYILRRPISQGKGKKNPQANDRQVQALAIVTTEGENDWRLAAQRDGTWLELSTFDIYLKMTDTIMHTNSYPHGNNMQLLYISVNINEVAWRIIEEQTMREHGSP